MSCRVDTSPLLASACVVSLYAGHGVRGDAVPATGDDGPSPVYEGLSLPDDAAKEYRWAITARPSVGVLVEYEDCSFSYTPPPGTETLSESFDFRTWEDGVDLGEQTASLYIGVTASTLTGTLQLGDIVASGTLESLVPSVLSGTLQLGDIVASGVLAPAGTSALSGTLQLGDIVASGSFFVPGASALSGTLTLGSIVASGSLSTLSDSAQLVRAPAILPLRPVRRRIGNILKPNP